MSSAPARWFKNGGLDASAVIEQLQLEPLGFEGGYYRETGRSARTVDVGFGPRSLSTSIYYMHTAETFGLMHKLRAAEVYHFYRGDPVELLLLAEDGSSRIVRLDAEAPQLLIPPDTWQGSRLIPGGRYALMGTTMSPGFHLEDFELGDRAALLAAHPDRAELIRLLTPERLQTPSLELAAMTADLAHAELRSHDDLAAGLRAKVPSDWPPPGVDASTLHEMRDALQSERAQRGWWSWYVIDRSNRELIGLCGFEGPPENGRATLVLRPQRSDPSMHEAVSALVAWAGERGASEIVSQADLRSLGFRPHAGGFVRDD